MQSLDQIDFKKEMNEIQQCLLKARSLSPKECIFRATDHCVNIYKKIKARIPVLC